MQKKGISMTFAAIIAGAIALIVLFVMASIFNVGASTIFKKFMGITETAEGQVKGDSCSTLFSQRGCYETCPNDFEPVPGTWKDCPEKDSNKKVCCEPSGEKSESKSKLVVPLTNGQ